MQLLERIDIFPSRVLQAERGGDERSLESGSSGENAAKAKKVVYIPVSSCPSGRIEESPSFASDCEPKIQSASLSDIRNTLCCILIHKYVHTYASMHLLLSALLQHSQHYCQSHIQNYHAN